MLHARRVGTATPACPGAAMDDQCRRRGNCQRNDNAWRCICSAGWAGRDCAVKIESWPNVVPRPIWDGSINPLLNSAVVTIGETGRAFLWRGLGKNRVVFRARVLQGRVEVAGNVTQVGASGGIVQLFAKLRGSNEGDGLEFGTDVATVYDQRARGTVVVQRKGENEEFYELVVVSREAVDEGVWMVALFVTGGEAVVSLRARKCGGDLLECPFGNDEGKFPVGVALAVSAVAIIMFVVLGLLYMCLRKRKGSHKRSEVAWEGVALPVNDTVMTNKERVNADVDRSSTVKSDLTFLNVEKRHEEQSSMTRSDDTAQKLDSKGIVERRVHQFQQGAGGGQTPLEEAHEEMREEMRDTEWTQRVQWEMAQSNARVRDAWAREARMENGDSLHI